MSKQKRGRIAAPVVVVLILLALAGFVGYNLFQVKQVHVIGNDQFSEDYIVSLAAIPDKTQMIKLDELQIKQNIEKNPYLELKSVNYELPDTVILTVMERQPAALLDLGGSNALLLDRQMMVLKENDADDLGKYPVVTGIAIKSAELGKQISTSDAFKLSVYTAILDELKNQDLLSSITQINLADVNNIKLKTNGGPDVFFGQSDSAADKIGWIKKLLPTLVEQGKTAGILDVSAGSFAAYGKDETGQATNPVQTEAPPSNGQPS